MKELSTKATATDVESLKHDAERLAPTDGVLCLFEVMPKTIYVLIQDVTNGLSIELLYLFGDAVSLGI